LSSPLARRDPREGARVRHLIASLSLDIDLRSALGFEEGAPCASTRYRGPPHGPRLQRRPAAPRLGTNRAPARPRHHAEPSASGMPGRSECWRRRSESGRSRLRDDLATRAEAGKLFAEAGKLFAAAGMLQQETTPVTCPRWHRNGHKSCAPTRRPTNQPDNPATTTRSAGPRLRHPQRRDAGGRDRAAFYRVASGGGRW
jgi:hypothetical protein